MSEADAAAGSSSADIGGIVVVKDGDTESTSRKTEPSKRQRRLQQQYKNTNGLWEQPQPRIKSLEQREAAHLRASGLVEVSSSRTGKDGKLTTSTTISTKAVDKEDVTSHFARKLGSADARVRHQTVRMLKAYLKIRSDPSNPVGGFTELDLSKLWKCLWYTLYLCDRAPVQDELSQQLCSLIWSFAGSLEQDEYIAQAYLDACNEDGFMDDEESSNSDEDDDIVLEEIENTLDDEHSDTDDDNSSSESSDLDLEAKQLAILQDDEYLKESDDEVESSESSDVDFEAKQLALLNDDEEEFEDAEDDVESDTGSDSDEIKDRNEDDCEDDGSDLEVSEIRHCQGAHLAALFVRTFWSTCLREWGKMDKYRVDKFYTCLRYMLAATYDYMASRHWSLGIIRLFNDALYEEVLSKTPNGVRYHIIDCCIEELCRSVARSGGFPLTEATMIDVLEPYFALAQTGDGDDTVQARVTEQVLVKFLTHYSVFSKDYIAWRKSDIANDSSQSKIESNGSSKSDVSSKALVLDQVHVGTLSKFIFEVAADDAVAKDEYRQSLYNVHKQYERVMRQVGAEFDVDVEGENEMDDEEEFSASDNENESNQTEDLDVEKSRFLTEEADETVENGEESDVVEETTNADCQKSTAVLRNDVSLQSDEGLVAKKRKMRKKNKTNLTEVVDASQARKEEVVSISKAEQTAAKSALKEKQKVHSSSSVEPIDNNTKKRRSTALRGGVEENRESLKRVKFGDINRARSWKASMQGLQEVKIKPILEKSPERSILLKKGAGPISIQPQGKRNAHAAPFQRQGKRNILAAPSTPQGKRKFFAASSQPQGKRNFHAAGRKKARDYF